MAEYVTDDIDISSYDSNEENSDEENSNKENERMCFVFIFVVSNDCEKKVIIFKETHMILSTFKSF